MVDGKVQAAVCGSTNFSWRGMFVQNGNAIILRGRSAVKIFSPPSTSYWASATAAAFGKTGSAAWNDLGLTSIDAEIGFSPRAKKNAVLTTIADDISRNTTSSLFYSLAFLYQTKGAIRNAFIKHQRTTTSSPTASRTGRSVDSFATSRTARSDLVRPGCWRPTSHSPSKAEPTGGSGLRLHHKFVVIDFDKPTARVYMGSFNFSATAGILPTARALLLIRDRRIAVSCVIEALRIFDHYEFRVIQSDKKKAKKKLQLAKPPRKAGEKSVVGGGLHERQEN